MEVNVGNFEVIESGSLVSHEGEPIDFILQQTPSLFAVRILFRSDPENTAMRMESAVTENRLHITLFNFNNSLGTGNTTRLNIGTLDNRSLHFSFWVVAAGNNGNKVFHYTWYRGDLA
jgi:hypothetical protein